MAGVLTELEVAGKLAIKAIGRKLHSEVEPAPDLEAFSSGMQSLLDKAPTGVILDYTWLNLSAKQAPWVASEMSLATDDEVSCFTEGRIYANKLLDVWIPLVLQIWSKVGEGDIFRGTRNSHSFIAQNSGPLQFGNYFPNDWADQQGTRRQNDDVYDKTDGEARILIIRWSGSALDGLQQLQALGDYDNRVTNEIERIQGGDTTPIGWHYLWNIGPSEIYSDQHTAEGSPCIHCHTHGDIGILQKNIDVPLDESSEISWRWCIDQLPSPLREDAIPTHDYLSIAVEFDNGRDITYYWSSTLPEGTGYDCPLPNWKGKEYHVVVRSGTQGLGQWLDERRNLYQDYQHYMGEPPARIVKVWLIANSIFQRNTGTCDYADIVLHQGANNIRVL